MRWTKPESGDTRIVKRFALFPMQFDRDVIWLEWVHIRQVYKTGYYPEGWRHNSLVEKVKK